MSMTKRMVALVLALLTVVLSAMAFAACGDDTPDSDTTTTAATTTAATTTTTKRPPIVAQKPIEGGTEDNPTSLDTKEKFLEFVEVSRRKNFEGQYFRLDIDIVLNDTSVPGWYNDPNAFVFPMIGTNGLPFAGTLDGNGHTIEGVLIKGKATDLNTPFGFFAATRSAVPVKNLCLLNERVDVEYGHDGPYEWLNDHRDEQNNAALIGKVNCNTITVPVEDDPTTDEVETEKQVQEEVVIENCIVIADIFAEDLWNSGHITGLTYSPLTIRNCIIAGRNESKYGGIFVAQDGCGTALKVENCLSLVTSASSGVTDHGWVNVKPVYQNIYGLQDAVTKTNGNFTYKPENELIGTAAQTTCVGFDFENVWQVNGTNTPPSLKTFGENGVRAVQKAWDNAIAFLFS